MPMFESSVLSWPEAEAAFLSRLAISAEEFALISQELRGVAWTISRIAEHQTLLRVKRKLAGLIAEGGTLWNFSQWVSEGGASIWSGAYTELVFRMASLGAYSKARWDEINDSDLGDEFPYIMYDAVNDDRTREEHAEMDGKTWLREDFPEEWVPPNGYNCRCELRNLNENLMRRAGGELQGGAPSERPDKGFQANQAADYGGQLDEELSSLRGELGG